MENNTNSYTIPDAEAQRMIKDAIDAGWLLWIKCSAWGNRKKLAKDLLEEKFQEDANAIRASQKLLDTEAVARVTRPMDMAKNEAYDLSKPWFHKGVYYFDQRNMQRMEEVLQRCSSDIQEGLDWLVANYENLKKNFSTMNPRLYDPVNYPSADMLRSRFHLQWGWQKVSLPMGQSEVSVVGKEMVDRENRRFQEMMKEAVEEAIAATRRAFMKIITHLREVLNGDKVFHQSTLEKPKEFLKNLSNVNLFGDKPFEDLAGDISEILDGVYSEDLRDDDVYRNAIGNALDDVVEAFSDLPTVKLERAVSF